MPDRPVRVRFAPSPTGPLHIGGVRTALYNYLFAKKHSGTFILRIEDTDQNRFVPGAEEYIAEALKWLGIDPDEGPLLPPFGGLGAGPHAPYRQSERKMLYHEFAQRLIDSGNAYYAFDTTEELEVMRKRLEAAKVAAPQYNAISRATMKNSLTLSEDETRKKLSAGEPYVIRIKIPRNEEVRFHDIIRGWVVVHTSSLDDKVLFKSDGMPTYHLANVVDDYLMDISHVIRGEEWLPSAPLHVLLYRYLGWENIMPQFAHLPLLLRPDGNGKLSKRDGDRLGFPVFPLNWVDPVSGESSSGYREKGYFPDAVLNLLALLGWHPGNNQEIFTKEELIEIFSLEKVNKAGAKFDPDKAKWFNQQYLRKKSNAELAEIFKLDIERNIGTDSINGIIEKARITGTSRIIGTDTLPPLGGSKVRGNIEAPPPDGIEVRGMKFIESVCSLLKEKAHFVNEFWSLGSFFFVAPTQYDEAVIQKRWKDPAPAFFTKLLEAYNLQSTTNDFTASNIEAIYKKTAEENGVAPGSVTQLFRVIITGMAAGPALFETLGLLGKEEVVKRIQTALNKFDNLAI